MEVGWTDIRGAKKVGMFQQNRVTMRLISEDLPMDGQHFNIDSHALAVRGSQETKSQTRDGLIKEIISP